jgi:hypothetical protein
MGNDDHKADSSESVIRVTDPLLQESIAASGSEAGMVNDDHKEVNA